jgi:hypothetical protein
LKWLKNQVEHSSKTLPKISADICLIGVIGSFLEVIEKNKDIFENKSFLRNTLKFLDGQLLQYSGQTPTFTKTT